MVVKEKKKELFRNRSGWKVDVLHVIRLNSVIKIGLRGVCFSQSQSPAAAESASSLIYINDAAVTNYFSSVQLSNDGDQVRRIFIFCSA